MFYRRRDGEGGGDNLKEHNTENSVWYEDGWTENIKKNKKISKQK